MASNNSSMLPILLLLACCCCSSSASGAGAYFLGYVPGNDKYYIRIFQLEKMFQIIEDIKNDMVYEGTAPNKYTGKIDTDFCDEVKDFYENLVEKRDDEIEKVTDDDFKKLVKNYMDDNEIKGYTYRQAIDIIEFLYASCDEDARVFKKTDAFTTKLTKLFKATPVDYANFAPSTQREADRKIFCDDDGDVKGFTSLHKEIVTDITAVSSLGQVWDESTGTLEVPSGFPLSDLNISVDYCAKDFTPIVPPACNTFNSSLLCPTTRCKWTASADSTADDPSGSCGELEPELGGIDEGDLATVATDTDACTNIASSDLCVAPCEWNEATGCATPV